METPVALGLAFAKKFQAPRTPPRSCSDSVPVLNRGVISFLPSRLGGLEVAADWATMQGSGRNDGVRDACSHMSHASLCL